MDDTEMMGSFRGGCGDAEGARANKFAVHFVTRRRIADQNRVHSPIPN